MKREGVGREGERERGGEGERGGRENSECFIVEGHLTHYKRYDYKQTQTSYTKQLTSNNKHTRQNKTLFFFKETNTKQTNQQARERERERQRETERERDRDSHK